MEGLALVHETITTFYLSAILLSLFALLGIVDLWGKKRRGDLIAEDSKRAVLVLVLMSEALWVGGAGHPTLGILFGGVTFLLAWLLF